MFAVRDREYVIIKYAILQKFAESYNLHFNLEEEQQLNGSDSLEESWELYGDIKYISPSISIVIHF